ncbi:MAG: flagellar hook-associated protein FlgK [Pseudohongiellaceae bacterium]
MANLINTAVSGLKMSQLALSVTGQNIVNANTEGYSRQSITSETSSSQFIGVGYLGAGVTVSDISRNSEQFLVNQFNSDISVLGEFNQYLGNVSQIDNLLAEPATSISASLDDWFSALNGASNNPSGIESRQLLLTQTELLLDRFKSTEAKLLGQNDSLNSQLDSYARRVTTIASEIAELNNAISSSAGIANGNLPNDLLDRRDSLVADLASIVDVQTSVQSNFSMNVFIGEGQGLVIGPEPAVLVAEPGLQDPSKVELAFVVSNQPQVVTRQLTGGALGGVLRFREEALDPALNGLGRIALAFADTLNQQQLLGVDLEGNLGKPIFTDINSSVMAQNRVRVDSENAQPPDRIVNVHIDDLSQLTTSDYRLTFPGPGERFSIVRVSDSTLVQQGALGGKLPQAVSVDGFTINFESGSFQEGDNYLIQPTRTSVSNLSVMLSRAEEFSLASPLVSSSNLGNQGGAFISSTTVSDTSTSSFTDSPGALSPPVMVRFTSASTYDVLDVSDPSNPISLEPPVNNRRFVPGASNPVFSEDEGGKTVSSIVGNTGITQLGVNVNGYPDENIVVTQTDPVSGFSKETLLSLGSNQSAQTMASRLSAIDGVFATASSQVQLFDFQSDLQDEQLGVSLNGIDLTNGVLVEGRVIPDPVTPDFVRDSINSSLDLREQGIIATSDGLALTVRSSTGVDLSFEVTGNGGDSVRLRDGDLRSAQGRTNLNSGYNSPINSRFALDLGLGPTTVALTPGSFARNDVVSTLQADIDRAVGASVVQVSLTASGRLLLSPVEKANRLTISEVSSDDVLGLESILLSGPNLGDQPANLGPGASTVDAFDFSAANGSFSLGVNGIYSDTIVLNQSYPAAGGAAIISSINDQIAASTSATGLSGLVVAELDSSGGIVFATTGTGPDVSLAINTLVDMQGLVGQGNAVGAQLSGTQAKLTGNTDIRLGADFDSAGPHGFKIAIDGVAAIPVSLTGTTRLPATFENTVDVSGGVDLTSNPNTFELSIAGQANTVIDLSGVDTTLAGGPFDSAPQGILNLVQQQIDIQLGANVVEVSQGAGGRLSLTTVASGADTSITVSNPTGAVATDIFPVVGTSVGSEQGGTGVVDIVQRAIDASLVGTDIAPVQVGLNENGFLTISSSSYGKTSQISVSEVTGTFGFVFPGLDEGESFSSTATIGGSLDLELSTGTSILSNRQTGMFGEQPVGVSNYRGYQIYLNSGQSGSGLPAAGDNFTVDFNRTGTNDNSNATAMLELNNRRILSNGNLGILSAYGQMVQEIGILTSQSRTSQEASESLLRQSEAALQSVAGVNIDEEAANLIKFEQHYNASAQLISIARDLFDSLLQL